MISTVKHLLDTSVVVGYLRGDERVVGGVAEVEKSGLGLSVISVAELYHGAEKSDRVRFHLNRVNEFVDLPEVEVFGVSDGVAKEFGKLMAEMEKRGRKIGKIDALIAATAKRHRLVVLTQDRKHFARLKEFGVRVKVI